MWAKPRANPPPSAKPTAGRLGAGAAEEDLSRANSRPNARTERTTWESLLNLIGPDPRTRQDPRGPVYTMPNSAPLLTRNKKRLCVWGVPLLQSSS